MGYSEAVAQEVNLGDPFQRIHKFLPLIPNPNYLSSPNHSLSNSSHNQLRHQHGFGNKGGAEEGYKEGSDQQMMVSSRWNPTPEQITALEELYHCGTRTPSADQIQHITSQLRRYGKVEGKNVFYWFQNHKARERQKRRRQLQRHVTSNVPSSHANQLSDDHQVLETIGFKNKGFEDDEKNGKRTPFMSNKAEYGPPIELTTGPRKADMRLKFHEIPAEFQHNSNHNNSLCKDNLFSSDLRNATFPRQAPFSCCPPLQLCSSPLVDLHHNSPEDGVTEKGEDNGENTVSLTLQLFPILKPDDDDDNDGEDASMENERDIIASLAKNAEIITRCCMGANDFVPYYRFI